MKDTRIQSRFSIFRSLSVVASLIGLAAGSVLAPGPKLARATGSDPAAARSALTTADCIPGELLQDGGFEAGLPNPAWQTSSNVFSDILDDTPNPPPRTGSWKAWLGGDNLVQESLWQIINVPADAAGLEVSYWWRVDTFETSHPFDTLEVQIQNDLGTPLETLEILTDGDAGLIWQQSSFSLSGYAGQTIQLAFVAQTDGTGPTSFFLDDVSVLKTCAAASPTPTQTATTAPTATPTVSATATASPPATSTATSPPATTQTPTATATASPTLPSPSPTTGPSPTPTPTTAAGLCEIAGSASMQARTNPSGITVTARGPAERTTTTGGNGQFAFTNLPAGSYVVTASHPGYLSRQRDAVQCQPGQPANLAATTLLGGDATGDDVVDLFDLVMAGSAYNTCTGDSGFKPAADINGSGCIEIFDLVLVGRNYRRTGPVDWDAGESLVQPFSQTAEIQAPMAGEPGRGLRPISNPFELRAENLQGVYGIEVRLTFNARTIHLADAVSTQPGVQVRPGSLFQRRPHFVAGNQVTVNGETEVGSVTFAATLLHPAEPLEGSGQVLTIFYRLSNLPDRAASTAFTIQEVILVDQEGRPRPAEWRGNTIRQRTR